MKKAPKYDWDAETGVATCTMYYDNEIFIGTAICAPDDMDMMSEKVGLTIAEQRALIQSLCYYRDYEVLPRLDTLKQLFYTMKHSPRFNEKSYEAITLKRHIQHYEDDLADVRQLISDERKALHEYILKKDEFYQKVRQQRVFDKFNDIQINNSKLVFDYSGSDKT